MIATDVLHCARAAAASTACQLSAVRQRIVCTGDWNHVSHHCRRSNIARRVVCICCDATASAQRFCKRRRRPRSLCRDELPNFQFPASAFPLSRVDVKSQKLKRFRFQARFRDSRVQIAIHECSPFDVPVPICDPKPSSTFFTNQIRLRFRPNFRVSSFPCCCLSTQPNFHPPHFQLPISISLLTSNIKPVSSFQFPELQSDSNKRPSFQFPASRSPFSPSPQGARGYFQFPVSRTAFIAQKRV